jgi:hypothetical protein
MLPKDAGRTLHFGKDGFSRKKAQNAQNDFFELFVRFCG